MKEQNGALVISLDFEIMWGVCDKKDVRSYYLDNLLGVRQVIPALIGIFEEYSIHATFATVGMLFASDKKELENFIPQQKPQYKKPDLSPYQDEINLVGNNESEDPLHFASSLIDLVKKSKHQEIGCHTFCHYYCLEEGQHMEDFDADIRAAVDIAALKGIQLKSIVFPRNQFNLDYLSILEKYGFTSYRGNESSWIYQARNRDNEKLARRLGRMLDTYVNLTGNNIYTWEEIKNTRPLYNIPASRFLRPYSGRLALFETLRAARIKKDMTAAAKKGAIYHLWWHPHNFGVNLEKNLHFLRSILDHFKYLQKEYGYRSLSMHEVVNEMESGRQ